MLYSRTVDNAILGSAAILLVWSGNAAQSEWVEHHLLLAQRLKKPIFPVLVDNTELPNTLVGVATVTSLFPCTGVVVLLLALPGFPPSQSSDPLVSLWKQASHDSLISVRARRATIGQATDMLNQLGQAHREAVLALLEYFVQHDLILGVRNKARAVLEEDARKVAQIPPPPFLHPEDSRHIFGVQCKNGHITYFDKRRVCSAQEEGLREIEERANTKLHKLVLKCEKCSEEIVVHIDCEGY